MGELSKNISMHIGQLNQNAITPLYYQLKELLLAKIETGEWREGDQIPSESKLQDGLVVSRATVRKAIEVLVNEGHLKKARGKGTFVTKPKFEENLASLKSFSEEMAEMESHKEIISAEYTQPSSTLANVLRMAPDERVLHLVRLLVVEGLPIGVLYEYVPERHGLSLEEDFTKSLYHIFDKKHLQMKYCNQFIEAGMATKDESAHMGLKRRFATLIIKRIVYSVSDEPIQYVKGVYHFNRYRYQLKLFRGDSQSNDI